MPIAYSYLRFSTPEQARGDSFRRQTEMATEYAARHQLTLDETLTFRDLGVSAFRGANARMGALRRFRDMAEGGLIPAGSFLLVESLDRLSRETVLDAQAVFLSIINAGVTLVTLADSREYSRASLTGNPTDLIVSIVLMMRAHEESATKGRRLKAVWKHKRATAESQPLTARCPAWLRLDREAGRFEPITERAEIVRRIFSDTLAGTGQHAIAEALNREGVPVFGDANGKRVGKHWHRSYIAKIIGSPAVVGTFTPHRLEHENGRKVRKPAEPVPGYFPVVVDHATYQRVQSLRGESRSPLRGRHAASPVANIFGGLARCPSCDATMTLVNKSGREGQKSYRYLVCTRAKAKALREDGTPCSYRTVPYETAERAFLERFEEVLADSPAETAEGERIDQRLAEIDATNLALSSELDNLLSAVARSPQRPAAVMSKIAELETQRDALKEEESALRRLRAGISRTLVDRKLEIAEGVLGPVVVAVKDARAKLRAKAKSKAGKDKAEVSAWAVADAALGPSWRGEANTILRQLFKSVVVDYRAGALVFRWQHGGETEAVFGWPQER